MQVLLSGVQLIMIDLHITSLDAVLCTELQETRSALKAIKQGLYDKHLAHC